MPRLYERNIQQLRGSSFVITLPKEWVLESALEKGSSVLLAVEPYIIRIIPATKQVKRTAKLILSEIKEEQVGEIIKWAYLSGIDGLIIIQPGEISHNIRSTIHKLKTVIPGMIISYEDGENIRIEFAEPSLMDFIYSLKTFLESIRRMLQELVKHIEEKNREEADLSMLIEECMGNSLILSRLASKSIVQPFLNISTVSIYGLLATATVTTELAESIIGLAEIIRKYDKKSILMSSLIKDIILVINKIIHSISDFKKETFNESAKMTIDELFSIRAKIDSSDLDFMIKMALINCVEQIRMMMKYLNVYNLITIVYPY